MKSSICHICLDEKKFCKLKNYNLCEICDIFICKKCINDVISNYNSTCIICKKKFSNNKSFDLEKNNDIETESNEIVNDHHKIIAIKKIFNKVINKENILTLIKIILLYILLFLIGFIVLFIAEFYNCLIDDKNSFSITNIIIKIFTIDSFYIVLPCSGITFTCCILLIITLFINIHKCIKNLDWDTIV